MDATGTKAYQITDGLVPGADYVTPAGLISERTATATLTNKTLTTPALTGFTVATLPTGKPVGTMAYVTDAVSPTYLGTLTGGGTVICPVFYDGTAWVSH